MYICSWALIAIYRINILIDFFSIINSSSQATKNKFWSQFYLLLSLTKKTFENNNKGIKSFVIQKYSKAITKVKKNSLWDYYFNLINRKLLQKHI